MLHSFNLQSPKNNPTSKSEEASQRVERLVKEGVPSVLMAAAAETLCWKNLLDSLQFYDGEKGSVSEINNWVGMAQKLVATRKELEEQAEASAPKAHSPEEIAALNRGLIERLESELQLL